jgi:glycosyltransferase involved in cell wall biosynthesis
VLIVTGGGHASVVHDRLHRSATVVPIGANVDVAYQGDRVRARQELGLPEGAPLLAFFGFVHPVKGLTYLLDAVAELRAGPCPGLRLAVVGGWRSLAWPDAEADAFVAGLRDQAERLGLADAVAFLGFLPDEAASRWLTAADAAVLPFTHGVTAKSGSLLTCWAHRLPVVATEPPAGADPDVAGAVLPAAVRDVATLREATAEVLTDRSRAAGLADAGAARMGHRTWAQVSAQHRRVYEQALAS